MLMWVKTTVFLADIKRFCYHQRHHSGVFHTDPPPAPCYQVANLPKGALFEIGAIAVK